GGHGENRRQRQGPDHVPHGGRRVAQERGGEGSQPDDDRRLERAEHEEVDDGGDVRHGYPSSRLAFSISFDSRSNSSRRRRVSGRSSSAATASSVEPSKNV